MAMNHGSRQPARPPPLFEHRLTKRDRNYDIGELVLSGNVTRLFSPGGCDCPFDYKATLLLHVGEPAVVRVFKAAAGRETVLTDGWREISDDFDFFPGEVVVFGKALQDRTFFADFLNGDGTYLRRWSANEEPRSSVYQVNVDWLRAHGAEPYPGDQAAGAAGGGDRALQDSDMAIRQTMDLAVECGAEEGSDEHYMATKLFVKAENRAMFRTFRTNAGRLQWLRRLLELFQIHFRILPGF